MPVVKKSGTPHACVGCGSKSTVYRPGTGMVECAHCGAVRLGTSLPGMVKGMRKATKK